MARKIEIRTTTATVAQALGSSVVAFNEGCYYGTKIRLRQMTGGEPVIVVGTTAGARVMSQDGVEWIQDRLGDLGARQVKRLIELTRLEK